MIVVRSLADRLKTVLSHKAGTLKEEKHVEASLLKHWNFSSLQNILKTKACFVAHVLEVTLIILYHSRTKFWFGVCGKWLFILVRQ